MAPVLGPEVKDLCLRCGACCTTGEDNHDCPFLVRIEDGKTFCAIYPIRLGVEISKGFHCGLRKDTKYDFENCPYNSSKPMLNKEL